VPTVDVTHAYAEVNGVRLHYAKAGRSGPLVVFLHGFPEYWGEWQAQLLEFGRDRIAVAPDMRGYNLSSKPPQVSDYRIRHLIEDLRQLVRHFGVSRFSLVAHDWGGAVAWAFAAAHPEMLERLVVLNGPHPIPFARALAGDPEQRRASAYMNLLRSAQAERILSQDGYATLWKMLTESGIDGGHGRDRDAYVTAWAQPGALTAMLNYYRASPLYPPEGEGEVPTLDPAQFTVRVPTLVVWGERDRALLPGNLDGLGDVVPDLKIVRVPDASHWIVHERPELVNRAVREFLDQPL